MNPWLDLQVRGHFDLADEMVAAARSEAVGRNWRRCASSQYYARYHAVQAILRRLGSWAISHSDTRRLLRDEPDLNSTVTVDEADAYRTLHDLRVQADYHWDVPIPSDVGAMIGATEAFVQRMRQIEATLPR